MELLLISGTAYPTMQALADGYPDSHAITYISFFISKNDGAPVYELEEEFPIQMPLVQRDAVSLVQLHRGNSTQGRHPFLAWMDR